ncbi:MAG: hypothetical protein Q9213_006384 [Squamulea squamosa]
MTPTKAPSTKDLWFKMLERLIGQLGGDDVTVADVLNLFRVSQRNLNADEIHEYLGYDQDTSTWGKYRFPDKFGVWRRYPALLELVGQPPETSGSPDGITDNLGLIHPSLGDFLRSDAIRTHPLRSFAVDSVNAQEKVANRCVSYLLHYKRRELYASKRGWAGYAGAYWHQHVRALGNKASDELTKYCIMLLDHRTPSFPYWTGMTRRHGQIDSADDGDFGERDTYPYPLYYATLLGLPTCVLKLLRDGADVNKKGGNHEYPIRAAFLAGEEGLVELLIAGAETGKAAPKAVDTDQAKTLHELLELRADIPCRNKDQKTMAHLAVQRDHLSWLKILSEHGADLDACDTSGSRPLHLAVRGNSIACMEFLLSQAVDIEAKDVGFRTPLMMAAQSRHYGALVLLLEKGADVNASTKYGRTALIEAAEAGGYEALVLLLESGADVNACAQDGRTALHCATYNLDLRMVIALLNADANPNLQASRPLKGTPLHVAAASTHPKNVDRAEKGRQVVKVLLNHGADPNIIDKDGHLAETRTSDPELKALLRKSKSDLTANSDLAPSTKGFHKGKELSGPKNASWKSKKPRVKSFTKSGRSRSGSKITDADEITANREGYADIESDDKDDDHFELDDV